MKIKKYTGKTEKDAILKVKEELGNEALIISVKSVKPKGFFKFFRKPFVEVIATIDDKEFAKNGNNITGVDVKESDLEKLKKDSLDAKTAFLKNNLDEVVIDKKYEKEVLKLYETKKNTDKNNEFIKTLYDQLIDNEVLEENVNTLTEGTHNLKVENPKEIVAVVYRRIVDILSDYETVSEKGKRIIFFVGPTGVGKTTTIAKVASYFLINKNRKVALITSDTYRIAAVEQLRTYADILNIPVKVIYSEDELAKAVDEFKNFDFIFVDTAGRSPKNNERHAELSKMLDKVDEKDVYLVLSAATKYKDLKNIAKKYKDICDYKIIFTKLDETMSYGNILNTKLLTGAKLSYVTFGQNVPEDISTINPQKIAKSILGGVD